MGSLDETSKYDAVVIGAGFGGYTMLPKLRDLGLRVKIFERGSGSGGVWHWNQYPGARVDTDSPSYQFFDREIWEGFTFSERFPGFQELQQYFAYVEQKWNLRKDIIYNKDVKSAHWLEQEKRWEIGCSDGTYTTCRWLFANVGFAAKEYIPYFKGASDFNGQIYHTAHWPHHPIDLKDKRIAVVGTGASGVQVIQEAGAVCKHLTVFQRTPNLCLPMHQRKLDIAEEQKKKDNGMYEAAFKACEKTPAGVPYESNGKNTFDDSAEEREAVWDKLTEQGGFSFWVAGYKDLTTNQKANDAAYDYWRRMVLKRVKDPAKAKLLAPEKPPHPYGAKRPSLEQNYYEVMSQDNVDIIDLNELPIKELNALGIKTAAGQLDVDLIVLATGFDGLTGGFLDIDLRGNNDTSLRAYWKEGIKTSIGVAIPNFPNLFFLFGPQAPSTFSNGPSCIQFQGKWFQKLIRQLEQEKVASFEAREEAANEWVEVIRENWWNGANIPGKKIQPLSYTGGLPTYMALLDKTLENDYHAWNVR